VVPVIFTQGVNEMQSVAQAVGSTTLQDEINKESLSSLRNYLEDYADYVQKPEPILESPQGSAHSSISSRSEPSAVASSLIRMEEVVTVEPMSVHQIYALLGELEDQLAVSIQSGKNVRFLLLTSQLCDLLFAGRTASCKSAKDRTSMFVTFELASQICERHQFPKETVLLIANHLRKEGLRRQNCEMNTGVNRYAFNALQVKALPYDLRPPENSAGANMS
jgi:hypothetical protein